MLTAALLKSGEIYTVGRVSIAYENGTYLVSNPENTLSFRSFANAKKGFEDAVRFLYPYRESCGA